MMGEMRQSRNVNGRMRREFTSTSSTASFILAWVCSFGFSGAAVANQDGDDALRALLRQGLDAYQQGVDLLHRSPDEALAAFRESRDRFLTVIDAGVENGKLYYNLGNAHLRLGDVGEAIACYRRAERLTPGDEQLQKNLHFARSLRRDKIQASAERTFVRNVFFLHHALPWRTRWTLALTAYGLFWVILLMRLRWRRSFLRTSAGVLLLGWVSFGISAAISWPREGVFREGVVIADEVIVRKGNGDSYDALLAQPLHEGVEFTVLSQRAGWVQIELPDGKRGWVREVDATLL